MTQEIDKQVVTKGQVEKAFDEIKGYELVNGELKQSSTFGDYLYFEDIGKFGEDIATELRSEGKKVTHIKVDLLTELAKLPAAVPARRARVDEEIEGAIEKFKERCMLESILLHHAFFEDVMRFEAKVDRVYDQLPEMATVLLTKHGEQWTVEIQDIFGFKKDDRLIILVAKKKEDG